MVELDWEYIVCGAFVGLCNNLEKEGIMIRFLKEYYIRLFLIILTICIIAAWIFKGNIFHNPYLLLLYLIVLTIYIFQKKKF